MVARCLASDFDLIVCHPLECLTFLKAVDGVVIRNIWPTHEYQKDWDYVKAALRASGLTVYNPLTFKGDVEGKDYLVALYDQGYPVIPSIDEVGALDRLPSCEAYWIKPKHSCDGVGARKLTREELLLENPLGYIIQPFVEFEYEPSFFFIDDEFRHAIRQKHRLFATRTIAYEATEGDLDFARMFVRWAGLRFGTQRVDAVRTKDGTLLLTEVENLCPYLYLSEMDEQSQQEFLSAIKSSLVGVFSGNQDFEELVGVKDACDP